jgi:integrase/recombinase XerD
MSTLRQKMLEDLQLAGLAASTQATYVRAVRGLAAHFRTAPDQLTEKQVREYFLFLKNSKKYSPNTLRAIYAAIKFFYGRTVPRKWQTLDQLKIPRHKTLPDVLTVQEVRQLIARVRRQAIRTYMWTVYSCGLRLSEGLHLRVGDLDSQRLMIHVHRGKGSKDRYVPLPPATLAMLREYWSTHRHPQWLFPAKVCKGQAAAAGPMNHTVVQRAIRQVTDEVGIQKHVTIHTLRHSYATHLLEAGLNLRLIQKYLGHSYLQTTMIYLHLTNVGEEQARATINKLMQE